MHAGRRLLTAACAAGVVLAAATPAAAEPVLTKLGTLPTATNSGAYGVNNSGVAVGWMNIQNYRLAVRWAPDGSATEIDRSAIARAISDTGIVVGEKGIKAARWAPDGTATLLPSVREYCTARAVNDSGVVVGDCEDRSGRGQVAVRWNIDGTAQILPMSMDDASSAAYGINAAGAVVGEVFNPNVGVRAVRWNPDGTVTDLAYPPGAVYTIKATGINDAGQISGTATVQAPGQPYTQRSALRWAEDGSVTVLPSLTTLDSEGNAISADGTVVGSTDDAQDRGLAAKWAPDGTLTTLPTTGPSDTSGYVADAVNDNGMVVGLGNGTWAMRWTEQ
ncbi:hypothetical protein [Kibdelosporangium aridum]|uniref:Extracellular repeat, HAF family n=1 Tax=Kibdelosporangium aridum TaxID=2030 RepID=A0A1Y5XC85_KIBAR|nr:hypothetical protein [Kibdelosporangium aridum]SMC85619.1 hypothetical protein SAMN05661093_02242 [Kibdelosporangium aridum]